MTREDAYIEAYQVAMEDLIITDDERKMLRIQAKTLGISEERVLQLESIYNSELGIEDSE